MIRTQAFESNKPTHYILDHGDQLCMYFILMSGLGLGSWLYVLLDYDLVVFTASKEIYGAAVADKLDNGRNILRRRYYRQHCTPDYGSYTKDLSAICNDLNRVCGF